MSVVTFYGSDKIETAQTTSLAGITTYLTMEKNYKVLLINAKYNDTGLQECFWEQTNNEKKKNDLETGISGLIKAISSNKVSPEIITNYTRTVFKERLEILTDNNIIKENFEKQKEYMRTIIKMANKFYDLVFIDVEGNVEEQYIQDIFEESDLVVGNTTQRIKYIKEFMEIAKRKELLTKGKTMILLGKYDKYSKYNAKNLQKAQRINDIYGIPYNTLFFEACNEGKIVDFIINYRKPKETSVQAPIIEAISEVGQRIVDKLKELQMQY